MQMNVLAMGTMHAHSVTLQNTPGRTLHNIHGYLLQLRWPASSTVSSSSSLSSSTWKSHRVMCRSALVTSETQLQDAKFSLLRAVRDTERGLSTTSEQRSVIEESTVAVEALDGGSPLDLSKLDGTWLLQYTTASDVVSILKAAETPFLKVGQIFQKFECAGYEDGGLVRNVVRWSLPGLLQDIDGATLTVTAKFSIKSARNIALQFEKASVGNVILNEEFESLIAPAVLPRTFLTLQILQFIRGFTATFPLRSGVVTGRTPLGLLYYISYLDTDMLIGRALGSGGVFVFSKTQPLQTF